MTQTARTTTDPTTTQFALLSTFAGHRSAIKIDEPTYGACRDRGWITPIDVWPYHEITPAGRAVVDEHRCAGCGGMLTDHIRRQPCVVGEPTVIRGWWNLPQAGSAWREAGAATSA